MTNEPSGRALAIAKGLIRTGRALDPTPDMDFIRLVGTSGGFYWIANDGGELLRGTALDTADALQTGFVDILARAGAGDDPARPSGRL